MTEKKIKIDKIKEGDIVVCLPEATWANKRDIVGGAGFISNKVFKIRSITTCNSYYVLWMKGGVGVYFRKYGENIRKANQLEIEQYNKSGSFITKYRSDQVESLIFKTIV